MEPEPEFLSREVIEGGIDVHPSKNAIVIHYSVNARVLSENMETMGADLKECRKVININGLESSTDISSLAQQVVSQSNLISPGRIHEVEQLLMYLLTRKQSKPGFQDKDILSESSKGIRKQLDDTQNKITEVASLMDLHDYLELLYEELQDKVRGTGLILQLARNPDNLLELASNESLFLALTRVLRDDWRKSIELSSNIIYIFFCFSTFSNFHRMLIHYKVGSLCMTVIEHEINRYDELVIDTDNKRRTVRSTSGGKGDYEKAKKRMNALEKKQDILLRVCLYLLYNLAEAPSIEQKMKNKGIVIHLTKLLTRSNDELIILVVSFLKKLSIYGENKDEMAKEKILKKLLQLLPCDNEILMNVTLHLLMNLSFDPSLREEMITLGYLPKLVALLDNETHRLVVLFVLYLISMDDKGRAVFAYTECVPNVMKLLLETDEPPDPEVLSLAINLACHPDNAAVICHGPGLKLLMRKALMTQDSLLMKMIRNVSQHEGDIKKLFLEFIGDLGQIIVSCQDEDFLVEVFGVMANISIPNLDYRKVLTELNILPIILSLLKSPTAKDDIKLEIIILLGTFSADVNCASLLVNEELPQLLIDLLKVKQDDDDMILQISYTIYQWTLHSETRDAVMKTEAPDYFIALLNDKNQEVHKITAGIVDIMAEHNEEFSDKVKTVKFCYYNQRWLETVAGQTYIDPTAAQDDDDEDEDYMDPYYLQMAAELYSPEMAAIYNTSSDTNGASVPLPTSPLYPSPAPAGFPSQSVVVGGGGEVRRISLAEENALLAAYGIQDTNAIIDNDMLFYGTAGSTSTNGIINEDDLGGLYTDHPAFLMQAGSPTATAASIIQQQQQGGGSAAGIGVPKGNGIPLDSSNAAMLTHRVYHPPPRPPSRLNF